MHQLSHLIDPLLATALAHPFFEQWRDFKSEHAPAVTLASHSTMGNEVEVMLGPVFFQGVIDFAHYRQPPPDPYGDPDKTWKDQLRDLLWEDIYAYNEGQMPEKRAGH